MRSHVMHPPPPYELEALVTAALKEDAPHGDVTTRALIEPSLRARAHVVAKQDLTLAGVAVLRTVYRVLDPSVMVTAAFEDGATLKAGQTFATLQGPAHSILGGERVSLNFLQHLSGIATLTARFHTEIQQYPTVLVDTRKTIPGFRRLEKWAVALGGGTNHRMTLSDGVFIKDNHLVLLEAQGSTIREACRKAQERLSRQFRICVEVEYLEQIDQALDGGADMLLLDNMSPALVQEALDLIKGRAHTEVSGGITLENIREYAATGVDSISIGALTHSAPAVDISLDVRPVSSQQPDLRTAGPVQATPLEASSIEQRLTTRSLGRPLHLFPELASTNATAFTLADSGAPHGTAVLAEAQTAGKGRLGRQWTSPSFLNIYCSLILKDPRLSRHVSWIPLVTGLALIEATQRTCGIGISLKWPNDLLYIEKKIGGILCESASQNSQVSSWVVGFGLNVNCRETDFPEELRTLATSCHQVTRKFHDRNGLIAEIFNQLENWYDCVISEQFEHVKKSYEAACVTLGREVEIACLTGQTIRGTATNIGQDGALLVSTMREGKRHTMEIRSGDIHHLR